MLPLSVASTTARAATFRSGEVIVVEADEVIDDDLYLTGQKVTVKGTIQGDLVVFAQNIEIEGTVEGDLIAAGQTVVISGRIGDSVRIAGQVLKVASSADIDGDLLAAGFSLECQPETKIHGDLVYAGYQALLAGEIERNLKVAANALEIQGEIGGDASLKVEAASGQGPPPNFGPPPEVAWPGVPTGLTIGDTAHIGGDLEYASPEAGDIAAGAKIDGQVEHEMQIPEAQQPPPNPIWQILRRGASLLVVGLLLIVYRPAWILRIADRVREKPGKSLGYGIFAVALATFAFFVIFGLTLAACIAVAVIQLPNLIGPALVLGTLGMATIAGLGWFYLIYAAPVVIALSAGRLIFRQTGSGNFLSCALALVVGLLLVVAVTSIPFVGGVIALALMLLAVGGIWVARRPEPDSIPPEKGVLA